jgi:hypothetical protein
MTRVKTNRETVVRSTQPTRLNLLAGAELMALLDNVGRVWRQRDGALWRRGEVIRALLYRAAKRELGQ